MTRTEHPLSFFFYLILENGRDQLWNAFVPSEQERANSGLISFDPNTGIKKMIDYDPEDQSAYEYNFTQSKKQKKDKVFLPFIRMIFGMRLAAADSRSEGEYNMMEAELMQLSVRIRELHDLIDDDQDFIITGLSPEKRKAFAEIVRDSPLASKALRDKIEEYLRKMQ